VAGSARLDDLDEQMGLSLTDKEIDTVGGLVIEHYGSMPQPGDSFTVAGWKLTVRRATRKRIREVLIEPALGVGEGGNP
ncbi:MAG TPA: transporter associated domain-containing protein, partial [Chthoniobacterales bacterium]